ncbi:GntP family permease, partial [Undibacterium sp. Ji67W]|uniref:GntP family permease n=1 Tax=Undibacterium sp. Ji67W TaxID=3413042 RepID=UPI003BF43504
MSFMIILVSLALLMIVAYRGFSVILFAPICALIAVAFTDVSLIPPLFNGIFMEKLVGFVKLYFPVFLLGAVFGKLIELSGFSKSIVASVIKIVGRERAILSIVLVCAILTYGGVSLFVVVFAVYPFAAEMFRQSDLPKRLIPGTIALGAFTFTMDSLPGSPQIQNIIPTTFFNTNTWAAPWLGVIGAVFILVIGLMYLNWRRRQAAVAGEGYGSGHINEPTEYKAEKLPNAFVAVFPLLVVGVMNKILTELIPRYYGEIHSTTLSGSAKPLVTDIHKIGAIWAVEGALLLGILCILLFAFKTVKNQFADGSKAAVSGALLASLNTASEYGFGGIIAAMPGFAVISDALKSIPNPLINESITVTVLAGITGSASGGMSIALAAMSETFIKAANAAHIPMEVLHRVASMASGGMDTLRKRLASTVIDFFCLTRSLIQSAFYTKRSTTFHGNKSATLLIG